MKKRLENIQVLLWVIAACAVIQTTWFLGEKVLAPAAAIAANAIVDVNIQQIGGERIDKYYGVMPVRSVK